MSFISKLLKDKAVLWARAANGASDDYGQPVVMTPVQIPCRWQDEAKEFIDHTGTRQVSAAVVYIDRDVVIGSLIMLGTLASLVDPLVPKNNPSVFEVRQHARVTNLRNTQTLYTIFL
jgi:hypothetical protein